jgi:hypothetical protein
MFCNHYLFKVPPWEEVVVVMAAAVVVVQVSDL